MADNVNPKNDGVETLGTDLVRWGGLKVTGQIQIQADGQPLVIGTGSDRQITHNGADSIDRNLTGDWYFKQQAHGGSAYFSCETTGGVETDLLELNADANAAKIKGFLNIQLGPNLTISSGAITVTGSYHTVDTEGAAATDDLVTINGGSEGDILVLRPVSALRTIVVKHGSDNVWVDGAADFSMDNVRDRIMLIKRGATEWESLSIASNGT